MSVERTFSIVKPDAVASGHAGEILASLELEGFRIVALRMTRLSKAQAEGFYAVHRDRPFFNGLVKFMTEGPVIVLALEREEAGLAQLEPELVRLGVARRLLLEVAVTVLGREAGDSRPEQLLFLRGTEIHCHCSL